MNCRISPRQQAGLGDVLQQKMMPSQKSVLNWLPSGRVFMKNIKRKETAYHQSQTKELKKMGFMQIVARKGEVEVGQMEVDYNRYIHRQRMATKDLERIQIAKLVLLWLRIMIVRLEDIERKECIGDQKTALSKPDISVSMTNQLQKG
jgi:hypothetical protein